MTTTSIFKLWTLLQEAALQKEALPQGAVYVSEEEPPEDTVIYYTVSRTPYWIRGPQESGEEAVPQTASGEDSEATKGYGIEYNKQYVASQEEFENQLNDSSSQEHTEMKAVFEHLTGQEMPDGGRGAIEIIGFNPTGESKLSIPEGSFANSTANGVINPRRVKYKVMEALVGSRYGGNDGIEFPQHHLDLVQKINMDSRQLVILNGKDIAKLKKALKPPTFMDVSRAKITGKKMLNRKERQTILDEIEAQSVAQGGFSPESARDTVTMQTDIKNPSFISDIKNVLGTFTTLGGRCQTKHLTSEEGGLLEAHNHDNRDKHDHRVGDSTIDLFDIDTEHPTGVGSSNLDHQHALAVVHEVSHAVYNSLPFEIENEVKAEYLRALENNKGFISRYSKAGGNDAEFFCESYAAYFAHTKMFRKRNPAMADIMDRVYKKPMTHLSINNFGGDKEKFRSHQVDVEIERKKLNFRINKHIEGGGHKIPIAETAFWGLEINKLLKAFNDVKLDEHKGTITTSDDFSKLGIIIPNGQDLPRPDENESEEVEKSLRNMITLQERKNPLFITTVFKTWTLLQKALPTNAVYSSEEPPPKDAVVYQTEHGKDYWISPLQATAKEKTARPWPRTQVGTYVLNTVDKDSSILDFGAGHGTQTTRLKNEGFTNVTAYDTRSYGEDSPTTTNPDVLGEKYNVVMASNVLNVQEDDENLDDAINTMISTLADNGKVIANFPNTPRKHKDFQNGASMEDKLNSHFNVVKRVGGSKAEPIFELSNPNTSMTKSWYTNPRGSKDPHGRRIRKEGDGGGAFGEGGGVAFTSTDSGIFTPTHSERERTPKKKKRSGVDRLADFLADDSPERKMEKDKPIEKFLPLLVTLLGTKASKDKKVVVKNHMMTELIDWVRLEMRKEDGKHFRHQTSGEAINDQLPRIDWARGNKEMPREDGVSEFEGKPNANAAISQKDEERRIRRLGAAEDKTANAPANGDLRLRWESGGFESDALHRGSSKDKEKGDVEDPADEHEDEEFISTNKSLLRMIKAIEES